MVRARENKTCNRNHQSSCAEMEWRKTEVAMGRRRQKRPESLDSTSGRNGPLTLAGKDGKVSARPTTPHREVAQKGEKCLHVIISVALLKTRII